MVDVFGIDLFDLAEMVGPYGTALGGLIGLNIKLKKQFGQQRLDDMKEHEKMTIRREEAILKKAEYKERHRKEHEARVREFNTDIANYAEKEMRAIKDIAWKTCYGKVNDLIVAGQEVVLRVVDDEPYNLELSTAMTKFKVALSQTLLHANTTMQDFITFDLMTSYDTELFIDSIQEKIEDVSRVWINTLKITGVVDVYKESLETAVNEHCQRSVERIMIYALRQSDNANRVELIAEYKARTLRIERIEETIEEQAIQPIEHSPFE